MRETLIGKDAAVEYNMQIFRGKIIDETKNTISVRTDAGVKKIIKINARIHIQGKIIEGNEIIKRPEDRIKK